MTEKVFRLKGNVNLWDYLEGARKKAWINAYHRLAEVYGHWLESPDNSITIRKELGIPPNIELQPEHCSIYLNILYDQCKDVSNSAFNLNSKIHVQRFKQNGKSRYAVIPECSGIFSDIFDFMMEDSQLTNIWFDENALVTKEFLTECKVTEDEWVERAEIYIERLDAPYDILTMNIIDPNIIMNIDPNLDNIVEQFIETNAPRIEPEDNEADEDNVQTELDFQDGSDNIDQEVKEFGEEFPEEVATEPQSEELIEENSDLEEFQLDLYDEEDNCEENS